MPSHFQRTAANMATKGSINSGEVSIAIIVLQTIAEQLIFNCFQNVTNLVSREVILKRLKFPSHFKIKELATATRSISR